MRYLFLVSFLAAAVFAQPSLGGSAGAGHSIFRAKCAICHSPEPAVNKVGPSLYGTFGRPAAAAEGYQYSPAMSAAGLVWDRDTLDAYLASPQRVVPGTRMAFPGVADEGQRDDLIAFLETLQEGDGD